MILPKIPFNTPVDWANPLTRGLVAAFRMAEGGGPYLYNSGSVWLPRNATLNTVNWVGGIRGKAVNFAGATHAPFQNTTSGTLVTPISTLGEAGPQLTIVALLRATGVSSATQQVILSLTDSSNTQAYLAIASSQGRAVSQASGSSTTIATGINIVDNQWVHLAMTHNGGTNNSSTLEIYQNGIFAANSTSAKSGLSLTRGAIGSLYTTFGANFLTGDIDHVYIFKRRLSRREIQHLYADPDIILCRPRKFIIIIPPVGGTGSFTFDALTVSPGTGSVANPITGTASITFDAMTVTGAGTFTNIGTGSFTLGALTISGTGSVINPVTGTASITFDALTETGAGSVLNPVTGTAGITFNALTVAGVGNQSNPVDGTGSITFGALTVAGEGGPLIQGTGSITFGDMTVAGIGAPAIQGSANIAFGDLTVIGDGGNVVDITGTGSAHFASITVHGTGSLLAPVTGVGNFLVGGIHLLNSAGGVNNPGGIQAYPTNIPAPLIGRKHRKLSRGTSTQMDSGRLRMRRMFTGPIELLEVQWNFTQEEFDTFRTWYQTTLVNGVDPFTLVTYDIMDDIHFIRETDYICAFMAVPTHSHSDGCYVVSGTLEVEQKSVGDTTIDNPSNPSRISNVPVLEHSFEDFACREMFHLKASGLEAFKAHTIQIADSENGPWRSHVYFFAGATGLLDKIFNNDYRGNAWFQVSRDHDNRIVAKPTNPPASAVPAPGVSVTNTGTALAFLWGDAAYNNKSASNQRINQNYSYYIVPRGRIMSSSGPDLDPDPTPRVVSLSGFPGTVTRWTRDNTDPTEDTVHPNYDGVANNIAVQHSDFGYAIRARSFIPGGCKSPITLILVDKAVWQKPYTTAKGATGDVSDTCDESYEASVRVNWAKDDSGFFLEGLQPHTFKSGDSCEDYGTHGILQALLEDVQIAITLGQAPVGVSHDVVFFRQTEQTRIFNKGFLGVGDAGEHFIGWDQIHVSTVTFFADTVTFDRSKLTWDQFPKCFTYCSLALGTMDLSVFGQYILNDGASDTEVLTGADGSEEKINASIASDPIGAEARGGGSPVHWVYEFTNPLLSGDGNRNEGYNFFIILTLHNDATPPKAVPDNPPLPVVPTPPVVPVVDRDDFEGYPTTSVAETFTTPGHGFNLGNGWDTAGVGQWVIQNITLSYGRETFEEYSVETITNLGVGEPTAASRMTGGDGWSLLSHWTVQDWIGVIGKDTFEGYQKHYLTTVVQNNFEVLGTLASGSGVFGYAGILFDGFWTIRESSHLYGREDFESESVGVIFTDIFHHMNHGSNWDLEWTIGDSIHQIGFETWEQYGAPAVIPDNAVLGLGSRWAGGSIWTFRGVHTYGYDTFEGYLVALFTVQPGNQGVNWNNSWAVGDV